MIDVLRSDLRTMMGSVSVCVTFPFFSTFCCVLNSYHHHAINIAALGFPGVKSGTVQSYRSGVCTFLSTLRCCGFLGPLALDQNSEKHGKTMEKPCDWGHCHMLGTQNVRQKLHSSVCQGRIYGTQCLAAIR